MLIEALGAKRPLKLLIEPSASVWQAQRGATPVRGQFLQPGPRRSANKRRRRRAHAVGARNAAARKAKPTVEGYRPSLVLSRSFTACGLTLPPDAFIT